MRIWFAALMFVFAFSPVESQAYENFIPLGQNYSPDDSTLPALNSEREKFNTQVDIYETDIYTKQRTTKEFWSNLQRFVNDQELKGANNFIDY